MTKIGQEVYNSVNSFYKDVKVGCKKAAEDSTVMRRLATKVVAAVAVAALFTVLTSGSTATLPIVIPVTGVLSFLYFARQEGKNDTYVNWAKNTVSNAWSEFKGNISSNTNDLSADIDWIGKSIYNSAERLGSKIESFFSAKPKYSRIKA
jgi:hypothetical protein